jgi:hypothetical protein
MHPCFARADEAGTVKVRSAVNRVLGDRQDDGTVQA